MSCERNLPRTMLVLGPGSTHLVTAANPWPPYEHIESCDALLIHSFSPVSARLLLTCDTAFYAIIYVELQLLEHLWDYGNLF